MCVYVPNLRVFETHTVHRVLICPFTFLPDNIKIHAFCVFGQENEWKFLNCTLYAHIQEVFLILYAKVVFNSVTMGPTKARPQIYFT